MKKLSLLLCLISLSIISYAVPARPGARQATQPDGTQITVYSFGDEVYHYFTDAEGNILERDDAGFFVNTGIKQTEANISQRRAAKRHLHKSTPRRVGSNNLVTRGLVILVNFSDVKFQSENTKEAFDELLNGDNYTYNGATGSVKKYYSDQSNGQFVPQFDVYGPVTLKSSMKTYGGNEKYNGEEYDKGVGMMVAQACQLAYNQYNIDLTKYDADNDGYVDFVDILYAGYGEADSNETDAVWPCEWALSDSEYGKALTLGSKKIDTFSCHQELDGYSSERAGIGTPCHEFGHVFGLPDFYDTAYEHVTLGYWDLMDGGAYNNDGNTPPGFSGYERMFAGWAKPRLITATEEATINELQSSQEVLIISTTGKHNLDATNPNPKTFYILENRQQTSWDKYLPGHGMLLWRIQYDATKWEENTVNNSALAKQGVAILAADGQLKYTTGYDGSISTDGDAGDPFPGTSKVTSYTKISGYSLSNIAETNGKITLKITVSNSGSGSTDPTEPTEPQEGELTFTKVTSAPASWAGQYLIVNEDAQAIFDASLDNLDAQGNYKTVSISNKTIIADASYSVIIEDTDNGYAIKTTSGTYFGSSSADKNVLQSASTPFYMNISISGGDVDLQNIDSKTHLRYNSTQTPPRFRFYKDATYDKQKPIQLYRCSGVTTAVENASANTINIRSIGQKVYVSGIEQGAQINIYNITGSMVESGVATGTEYETELSSGIYIIRVSTAEASTTQKVIVK